MGKVTSAETPELPLHVWLLGPEEATTLPVLGRPPKVRAHGAPEPPRPTPLGRQEAGFS